MLAEQTSENFTFNSFSFQLSCNEKLETVFDEVSGNPEFLSGSALNFAHDIEDAAAFFFVKSGKDARIFKRKS